MLLSDCVAYTARKHPDRAALVFQDRTWTFEDLRRRIHRVANAMARIAAPGDRVAVLTENRPEFVECYYGVPHAGMGLLFLNYRLNPRARAHHQRRQADGVDHRAWLSRSGERHPW